MKVYPFFTAVGYFKTSVTCGMCPPEVFGPELDAAALAFPFFVARRAAVFSKSTSTTRSFLATVVVARGFTRLGLVMTVFVRDGGRVASSAATPL